MGLQHDWRWCSTCQDMVYAGFDAGICHDGNPHHLEWSDNYSIEKDDEPDGLQHGWRWCRRCQVLVYSDFGDGICHDGQPHELGDSGRYSLSLSFDVPPDHQDGWRWCSSCQVLVYSGFGAGICHDGTPHVLSDSGPYNVAKGVAPKAPQPEPEPAIQVSERDWSITVEGRNFTPGGEVALAFVRGPEVKQVPLIADDQGLVFYHERDTAFGSGLVIARNDSGHGVAFAGTKTWFPRVPGGPVVIDHGTELVEETP